MNSQIICQLCNFSPETPGTFVDAMVSLAKRTRERLHLETFCVFPETARHRHWLNIFDAHSVSYGFVPRKRGVAGRLKNLLHGREPLLFHTHFSMYDLPAALLKTAVFRTSRIVWHYHNPTPSTLGQRASDTVKFRIIGRSAAANCIAVGDGVYRSLVDAGFEGRRLFLVRNGVDTSRFFRDDGRRHEMRKKLGLCGNAEDNIVFLMLGWDPLRKGVDVFIRAALQASNNGLRNGLFLIVGQSETREFVSRLPGITALGSRVRVIDPIADFPSILNGIDVLVSSSRSEGLSYAVAEALACGKVAICSDIPGVREVYDGVRGLWLFPSEDSQSLSEMLTKVAAMGLHARNAMGDENRRYIMQNYSLDRWAENICDIYSRLLLSETQRTLQK